jgi:hypothetical protein
LWVKQDTGAVYANVDNTDGAAVWNNLAFQNEDMYFTAVNGINTTELSQVANIDATTISSGQWQILGNTDQNLATTTNVTFNQVNGIDLTECAQLANINATTINATQWGYLGNLNQNLTTTSDVTFNDVTITTGLTLPGTITVNTINEQITDAGVNVESVNFRDGRLATNQSDVIIGNLAGPDITTGQYNICIGYNAGDYITEADDCICIGANSIATGDNNVSIGSSANSGYTTLSTGNVVVGYAAGVLAGTHEESCAIGYATKTRRFGTALGSYAESGDYGVSIGHRAGNNATVNTGNVFVGYSSGNAATGDGNTGIGRYALNILSSGDYNFAAGYVAGQYITTGSGNIAVGNEARGGETGNNNITIGTKSGYALTSANDSICIGQEAGYSYTLYGNIAIGQNASRLMTTGFQNTHVGHGSSNSLVTAVNSTGLGYGSTCDSSNQVRLGNSSVSSFKCQVALTVTSDSRKKKEIEEEEDGLEFIKQLHCKKFKLKDDPENKVRIGLLAQDVEAIRDKTTSKYVDVTNKAELGITYSDFIMPLINSVKELSETVEKLSSDIKKLKKKN